MGNGQINIFMKAACFFFVTVVGAKYSNFRWILFEQNCIVHFVYDLANAVSARGVYCSNLK